MTKYSFNIVHSVCVEINHCLAVKNNISLNEIKEVYSHPQALSQCSDFLSKKELTTVQYSNTATAAKLVFESDENIAAICSPECAKSLGLNIIAENISNISPNNTKFICITKNFLVLPDANTISVVLKISNNTGSLYRLLTKFFVNGLNLDKIESRPIKDGSFEVMFYLVFKGDIRDKNVRALILNLEQNLEYFKLLGAYSE